MFKKGDRVVLTQAGMKFLSDFSGNIKRAMKNGSAVVGFIDFIYGNGYRVVFNFDGKVESWYVRVDTDIELLFDEEDFQAEDMSCILCW
jgi:hypothetical protein